MFQAALSFTKKKPRGTALLGFHWIPASTNKCMDLVARDIPGWKMIDWIDCCRPLLTEILKITSLEGAEPNLCQHDLYRSC